MPRIIEVELEADENDFTVLVTRKTAPYDGDIEGVCTLQGDIEDGRLYNIAVTDAISAQTRELPMCGRPNPPCSVAS